MSVPETAAPPQPLRKSAQRLRWFVDAFEQQVKAIETQTGNSYSVDTAQLAHVFAEWLKAFEAQKPDYAEDKPAYVGFAAGLMLRTLIKHKPAVSTARPANADDDNPAYFWPEGYLYVAFCLNVRGLVLEADYGTPQQASTAINETRTWWSFRENVAQDPALAIAFLDLFAGEEPDWQMPQIFRSNHSRQIAQEIYGTKIASDDDN